MNCRDGEIDALRDQRVEVCPNRPRIAAVVT
jgi:hypothetical protein